MSQTNIIRIMRKVNSFPSMPETAAKILTLLEEPQTTVSQIEEILRFDPGLTANILKLTNSAYFGFANKVGSVRQAVVFLGLKRLTQLVMASCVNALLDKSVPGYELPSGDLWRHSIAVSVAAEGLVRALKIPATPEVLTAALLHDVGKLVLGEFVKNNLDKIETVASRGISFDLAVREVLGTDHAEIGALILKNWSFPMDLVNAVRWHHEPDSAEEISTLTDIVHVADVLTLMIGIGVGREGLRYEPSSSVTKRIGLQTFHLEVVASKTLEWINELSDIFKSD